MVLAAIKKHNGQDNTMNQVIHLCIVLIILSTTGGVFIYVQQNIQVDNIWFNKMKGFVIVLELIVVSAIVMKLIAIVIVILEIAIAILIFD